jgi:hypothetical protein
VPRYAYNYQEPTDWIESSRELEANLQKCQIDPPHLLAQGARSDEAQFSNTRSEILGSVLPTSFENARPKQYAFNLDSGSPCDIRPAVLSPATFLAVRFSIVSTLIDDGISLRSRALDRRARYASKQVAHRAVITDPGQIIRSRQGCDERAQWTDNQSRRADTDGLNAFVFDLFVQGDVRTSGF